MPKIVAVIALLVAAAFPIYADDLAYLNARRVVSFSINQYDPLTIHTLPQTVLHEEKQGDLHYFEIENTGTITQRNPNRFDKNSQGLAAFLEATADIDCNDQAIRDCYDQNFAGISDQDSYIQAVVQFVSKHISYDPTLAEQISQGKSFGRRASEVLMIKKGTCGEFTNVFIALMRLRHIPSKYIVGVVIQKNSVSFHAWAEIYLQDLGWVPADPQMGVI